MNPNGMRAWRRFARGQRRKQNRANRASRASWIADGTGRWYRRQQGFFKQRPSVPARPFSPRSLVGMTQGARKRAAWRDANTPYRSLKQMRRLTAFDPAVGLKHLRSARSECTKYRIGQRLRSCPGCVQCLVCVRCENEKCEKEHHRQTICDGSGVLPAGSEK